MKKLLKNLLNLLRVFFGRFSRLYDQYGRDVLNLTYELRRAILSTDPNAVNEFIANTRDLNTLRTALKALYPGEVDPGLSIVGEIGFIITWLKRANDAQRNAFLIKVASILLRKACNEEISESDADTLAQLWYKAAKEGKI